MINGYYFNTTINTYNIETETRKTQDTPFLVEIQAVMHWPKENAIDNKNSPSTTGVDIKGLTKCGTQPATNQIPLRINFVRIY